LAHGAGSHLRILEAGCGNRWPVDLKGQSYELKGVDIDVRCDLQKRFPEAASRSISGHRVLGVRRRDGTVDAGPVAGRNDP